MEYTIETEFPNKMILAKEGPCLSLYMPTHRNIFRSNKDSLVFKNLVKEAESSLEQVYSSKDIHSLISLLNQIEDNNEFWKNSLDGLAIFATLDKMIIYRLEKELQPIAIVSNSFHIKPIIEYYQGLETFSILALEANTFALYEGNHLGVKPIELSDDVDVTLSEVLGTQHTESFLTRGSYGGSGKEGSTFHGHGGKSDDEKIDEEKYFRYVDRFVLDNISKNAKYPLVLVTHKEHDFVFRNLSNNPYLLDESIEGSYSDFKKDEMKIELKRIFVRRFSAKVNKAIEKYNRLKEKELSSDQINVLLKALLKGKVDTVFIEKDLIIPGKINLETRKFVAGDISNPKIDDLLEDIIQQALLTNSKIYILSADKMPSKSGVAAIFRY